MVVPIAKGNGDKLVVTIWMQVPEQRQGQEFSAEFVWTWM